MNTKDKSTKKLEQALRLIFSNSEIQQEAYYQTASKRIWKNIIETINSNFS